MPTIGETISHYRILNRLGGMGIVHKAEDMKLGCFVVLNFLPEGSLTNLQAFEQFERECALPLRRPDAESPHLNPPENLRNHVWEVSPARGKADRK